jgi:hypothetical protein
LLFAENGGLLFEKCLECPFGHPLSRGGGNLFHGSEVHIKTRTGISEGSTGNDFSPLGGELTKFQEFFGCEESLRHDVSSPEVTPKAAEDQLQTIYESRLSATNLFMTSEKETGFEIQALA